MVCMIIMLVIMMLAVICVHMVLVTILVLAMAVAVCLMAVPITMIVIMCMAGVVMCMLILGILQRHDGGQSESNVIVLVTLKLAILCVYMVLVALLVLAMAVAVYLMAVLMCMAGADMCMLILGILHSHDGGQTVSSVTVLVILVLALFGVYVGLAALLVLAVGCDGTHCAHNMTVVMCIAGIVMCMPILGVLLGTHMTRVNDAGSAVFQDACMGCEHLYCECSSGD